MARQHEPIYQIYQCLRLRWVCNFVSCFANGLGFHCPCWVEKHKPIAATATVLLHATLCDPQERSRECFGGAWRAYLNENRGKHSGTLAEISRACSREYRIVKANGGAAWDRILEIGQLATEAGRHGNTQPFGVRVRAPRPRAAPALEDTGAQAPAAVAEQPGLELAVQAQAQAGAQAPDAVAEQPGWELAVQAADSASIVQSDTAGMRIYTDFCEKYLHGARVAANEALATIRAAARSCSDMWASFQGSEALQEKNK